MNSKLQQYRRVSYFNFIYISYKWKDIDVDTRVVSTFIRSNKEFHFQILTYMETNKKKKEEEEERESKRPFQRHLMYVSILFLSPNCPFPRGKIKHPFLQMAHTTPFLPSKFFN